MTYEVAEVLATVPHRTWDGGDKGSPLYYFMVKLTDEQIAEAGKKKADTPPSVGDRYKELRALPPNAPSDAVPTLKGPITDFQGGGGGSKDYKADPAKLRSENYRSALHGAIALVGHGQLPLNSDQIIVVAEKFYDAIEQKAKVGE